MVAAVWRSFLTISLGTSYTEDQINAAAQKCIELASQGKTLGTYRSLVTPPYSRSRETTWSE